MAQGIDLGDGNAYEMLKTNPEGQQAKVGEYLRFHASMKSQTDSLLFSTREAEPQVMQLDTAAANRSEVARVLQMMRTGEVARISMSLDQFESKPPGMEKDSLLRYEVELLEVLSKEAFLAETSRKEAEAEVAREGVRARQEEVLTFHSTVLQKYRAGTLEGIQETPSGLKYVIHEQGGQPVPGKGDMVAVNYIGSLAEGDKPPFDQSFQRGEPIKFSVGTGRVIPGWDEGLLLLPGGSKATFFIPAELGYGEQGTPGGDIPPNAELVFYVEVE